MIRIIVGNSLDVLPTLPPPLPRDLPLVPEALPDIARMAGVPYELERVDLADLDGWKRRHGLRYDRTVWAEGIGAVVVYERKET